MNDSNAKSDRDPRGGNDGRRSWLMILLVVVSALLGLFLFLLGVLTIPIAFGMVVFFIFALLSVLFGAALLYLSYGLFRKSPSRARVIVSVITLFLGLVVGSTIVQNVLKVSTPRVPPVRTKADMSTVRAAIEAFAIDNEQYPEAKTMEELAVLMEPTYIGSLPRTDGWGHPFRYASWRKDAGATGPDEYVLVSGGKDGLLSREDLREYKPRYSATELVVKNGDFIVDFPNAALWKVTGTEASAHGSKGWGLGDGRSVVGRSRWVDIRVEDPAIASRQFAVEWDESAGAHVLQTLDENPVYLSGEELKKGDKRELKQGAQIRIGGTDLQYVIESE